jgi:hypothetical protein
MSEHGRYRRLYVRLWRHPGFAQLTDTERLLALYVLTGPQSNRIGIYNFSIATASEQLGTVPQTLTKRLATVAVTFGWLFDASARVLYVPSWWRFNTPENANVLKGNLKDLNELPPCALVEAFASNLRDVPEPLHETFLNVVRERLPQRSPIQDQEQENRSRKAGKQEERALKAVHAKTTNKPEPNARVIRIARDVLHECPRQSDLQDLIDSLQNTCRSEGIHDLSRAEAIAALTTAGADMSVSA